MSAFRPKIYVENGLVDYDGISRDYLFRLYLKQIAAAKPCELSTDIIRLAFYINAYIAPVINGVINHRIENSTMDYQVNGKGFFDLKEHIVAGNTLSLNDIEHKIIRPGFQDPRIHMALVCAAKSCPGIRAEAYIGYCLDKQLEDQRNLFCNDPKYVFFSRAEQEIFLSPILKWYAKDWEDHGGLFVWLATSVRDPTTQVALHKEPVMKYR